MARTKNAPDTLKIDAPLREAINALVVSTASTTAKGEALATKIAARLNGRTEIKTDEVKALREAIKVEVLRECPQYAPVSRSAEGASDENKRRGTAVRVRISRTLAAARLALKAIGITMARPESTGGASKSDAKIATTDQDGRTSRKTAAAEIDEAISTIDDATAKIGALRAMITAALKSADYVKIVVAAERIMTIQDAE